MRVLSVCTAFFCACAHVPDFRPSRPIEKAATWHEALLLCTEYRIEENEKEVDVLKIIPWVRCAEKVFFTHASAKSNEAFALFFRELSIFESRYVAKAQEVVESVDPRTFNAAVLASFRWIALAAESNSDEPIMFEGDPGVVAQVFPDYAYYLAKRGAFPKKTAISALKPTPRRRPEVEAALAMKKETLAGSVLERSLVYWRKRTSNKVAPNAHAAECLTKLARQANLQTLEELEDYRSSLEPSMSRLRVERRIDELLVELGKNFKSEGFELARCLR
ncbi:MAG TPA: hypothetical protein PLH57_05055 [Oligoflexia bacterium]|nr:hypothetical protein [Oligoflexia bacterium]